MMAVDGSALEWWRAVPQVQELCRLSRKSLADLFNEYSQHSFETTFEEFLLAEAARSFSRVDTSKALVLAQPLLCFQVLDLASTLEGRSGEVNREIFQRVAPTLPPLAGTAASAGCIFDALCSRQAGTSAGARLRESGRSPATLLTWSTFSAYVAALRGCLQEAAGETEVKQHCGLAPEDSLLHTCKLVHQVAKFPPVVGTLLLFTHHLVFQSTVLHNRAIIPLNSIRHVKLYDVAEHHLPPKVHQNAGWKLIGKALQHVTPGIATGLDVEWTDRRGEVQHALFKFTELENTLVFQWLAFVAEAAAANRCDAGQFSQLQGGAARANVHHAAFVADNILRFKAIASLGLGQCKALLGLQGLVSTADGATNNVVNAEAAAFLDDLYTTPPHGNVSSGERNAPAGALRTTEAFDPELFRQHMENFEVLYSPLVAAAQAATQLHTWENPGASLMALVLALCVYWYDWVGYILPAVCGGLASILLLERALLAHLEGEAQASGSDSRKPQPPRGSAVMGAQAAGGASDKELANASRGHLRTRLGHWMRQALDQSSFLLTSARKGTAGLAAIQNNVEAANIAMLKLRTLHSWRYPELTTKYVSSLLVAAAFFSILSLRHIYLCCVLFLFTSRFHPPSLFYQSIPVACVRDD
ncbi:hypothetical protein CYMTET_24523 [Cymbomonas tetramitiformis]|uniref:Uncharacterized protein n=1 Tax=Cymbomonas tetramitiformis TaxID=36881 RepID=A0AAE0L056_9CHLO|nr:hypothetical protein CYMTET_24523 [Cymbomonas tetramitiformis]